VTADFLSFFFFSGHALRVPGPVSTCTGVQAMLTQISNPTVCSYDPSSVGSYLLAPRKPVR